MYDLNIANWKDVKEKDNVEKILSKLTLYDVLSAINNAESLMKQCKAVNDCKYYMGYKYYSQQPSLNLHEFIKFVLKKCGIEDGN